MVDITETVFKWTNEQKAEATVAIVEWFAREGRSAAILVSKLEPNTDEWCEAVSWFQDIADGVQFDG